MSEKKTEREEKAINELIDKHGSFDEVFLNENDQMHVGFAKNRVTMAIHDAIEKGKELANERRESETKQPTDL